MKVGDLIRIKGAPSVASSWCEQLCIVTELTETRAYIKRLSDGYVGSVNPDSSLIEPAGGEDEADHN